MLIWASDWEQLMRDNETIQSRLIKILDEVQFVFYDDQLEVLMRPHKLYNNNLHNANDFTPEDCIGLLRKFFDKLEINADQLEVVNIEFGVNVKSPVEVKELISCITYHDKNEFRNHVGLAYSKVSSSVNKYGRLNRYKQIKAYAKGVQYPQHCNRNTFRFEIKSDRRAYMIQVLNVWSVSDLFDPLSYDIMSDLIISEWQRVLILQRQVDTSSLTKLEQKTIERLTDSREWYEISQSHRNRFSKSKKRLEQLMKKTPQCYKSLLTTEIETKIELLSVGCKF
ncbi:hypothetical protein [Gilvibacter sp. SZ-19]|uniref:hypothetical protein n=1 Tax=Gilvibacter sp. SZ-19 TaxID=754429 RepID=UPI0012FCB437|nr:hypothetical protein [Gilvibacter sp. SZ-19]